MLGLADCQVSLGHMFELGRGVKQDYTPAVRYYKAAAEQGHAGAQAMLQAVYEKVNREYVDAQKAVAQQQQTEQQQKHLQQRYQQQLIQANQQQIFQHLQQQAAARGAAAPAPSVASIVAGAPAGIQLVAFSPFVDNFRLIFSLFCKPCAFRPMFS
jgi:TPR repeat protein